MILSPDEHESTADQTTHDDDGPPALVNAYNGSETQWQRPRRDDPDTDPEDDTELERITVDYRALNDTLAVDPFLDLGQPDRIQEEYEDFLLQAYASEDDPLWHDYSVDTHQWYSEDSDPPMVFIATLRSSSLTSSNNPNRPSVRISTGRGSADALPDTGAAVCVMAMTLFDRLAPEATVRSPSATRLQFANNSACPVLFTAVLEIEFPTLQLPPTLVKFFVADLPDDTVILDYSLLKSSGLGKRMFSDYDAPHTQLIASTDTAEIDVDPHTTIVPDHLPDLFDDLPSDLPPTYEFPPLDHLKGTEWHKAYSDLCLEFKHLFLAALPKEPSNLPPMKISFDEEKLKSSKLPPRRPVAAPLLQILREKVDEMLRLGVIIASTWWYQSPVVIVKQKGAYRFCTDYRHLNSCTTPLKFPIPLNRDTFQMFYGKKVLSSLDNRKGYYQLKLAREAMKWTTFFTPIGAFMYTRIPFGLISAPAYYNFLMVTVVLVGLIARICVSYFDDTAAYSDDHKQHLRDLRLIFERFTTHRLTLNGAKCQIAVAQIRFWGHVVDEHGYNHLPERQQQAFSYPRPVTKKQLERFLGLATYFSAHVPSNPGFARLRKRLAAALQEKKVVHTEDTIQAFELLKDCMVNSVKLFFPDYALDFHLIVDASQSGFGGYLYQLRLATQEPLVFVSLAFSAVQSRWAVEEQEAFAVYFAIIYCGWIVRGIKFFVHTDHKNLTYIREHASAKVMRWNLRLQEFDFVIDHIKGTSNITDGFSRAHEVDAFEALDPNSGDLSLDLIPQSLHPNHRLIECPIVDTSSIPPDHLKAIRSVHEASISGHRGTTATVRGLRLLNVSWPTMRADVASFVQACPVCQKTWLHQRKPQYVPATIEVYEPFAVMASDFIGPLPEDQFGNQYIHCLVDHATRYAHLFPAPGPTAVQVAKDLVTVFTHHDVCNILLSDRGPAYIGNVSDEYCRLLGIDHELNTPYRSQQNAIVERTNESTMTHLKALVYSEPEIRNSWSECIPIINRLLNTTYHSVLQCTPTAAVFGSHFTASRVLFPGSNPPKKADLRAHYNTMLQRQAILLRRSEIFQAQASDTYAAKVSPVTASDIFADQSLVLVTYPDRAPSKLHTRLRGPFRVLQRHPDDVYSCQNLVTGNAMEFHISQLRPYTTDTNPSALTPLEVASRDAEEFIVDAIIDHRVMPGGSIKKRSTLQFLVAWLGYGDEYHSWEPYANVRDLIALQDYVEATPSLAYLV